MADKKSPRTEQDQAPSERRHTIPKSLGIAENGIYTAQQFAALMSALMTDLLNGTVTPGIGNATCNAGGKLLKMVELNQKYGQAQVESGLKNMQLVTPDHFTPEQ
jgi:hypothetical protein